jgi:hypothetical protein|uniref:Uncharacterized protein n=1 Tax=Myoviridae sp. ctqMr7 TaxID=2823552 RepID=A0A8S5LHX6_9CAUD|nr:MAG TPA: hypothetical protein [Myoviridae sp. ctqMr7]
MKDFIKNIDWLKVELFLLHIILFVAFIGFGIFIFFYTVQNEQPEYSADTIRKIKICRTYSNDFWRNDIDFIDGKCYYKGKEVEIE